jgi:hypothetical protein
MAGAADGRGNRQAHRLRERAALAFPEGLPRGLEADVIGGAQRFRRIKANRAVSADGGNREARMGAADIDDNKLWHRIAHCSVPVR